MLKALCVHVSYDRNGLVSMVTVVLYSREEKNFMIFTNRTQFVNNFPVKTYLELSKHDLKNFFVKCDATVHLQNILPFK